MGAFQVDRGVGRAVDGVPRGPLDEFTQLALGEATRGKLCTVTPGTRADCGSRPVTPILMPKATVPEDSPRVATAGHTPMMAQYPRAAARVQDQLCGAMWMRRRLTSEPPASSWHDII